MRTDNPRHTRSGEHTGGRFRLANWRVRSRLVALILIPTIVGVLLAGVQLANAIGTSAEYRRLTTVAELVQRVGALSHELAKERTLTAWYMADRRRPSRLSQLKAQRQASDAAKQRVLAGTTAIDATYTTRVNDEVLEIRRWLTGLDGLRKSIAGEASVPPRAALRTYSSMIDVLENLQGDLGDGISDDRLQGDVAALTALDRTKEEVSRQQGILIVALVERRLDYDDLSDFLGSWNNQQAVQTTFETEATAADLTAYRKSVRGQQIDRADAMRQRALAQLREFQTIKDLDITTRRDIQLWYESTTLAANAMRKVEDGLATRIVATTRELSDTEQRSAIISGATILVLLLLVLVITTRVAGSLVRPLRRLRAEALQVATTRLPETVRLLRESGDSAEVPDVPSVGVNTRDEIGEVARAFDEVHREAIRLAGDEAKLRANVNSMFVNLSRRSQTLVERQLQLIEGLEQGEEDENRLANLFRLDHLATRMRRNSENLLVLAGQEAARKWSEPVPLVDIARASLSEVENYERVQIQIPSGIEIAGPAVTDAVHLLAELIENAISFSPRESKVQVTSTPIEGGIQVTINDLGIGMSADELAEANWRLANPPVVDVAVSRRMGLFVVGRLALRHGIRVQLGMKDAGGLAALVMLPDMLIAGPQGAVPQQRGQYEAFTTFDPSMIEPSSTNGSGVYGGPRTDTPDIRTSGNAPVDTQWPGSLPLPGGGGQWPPFGEEQPPRQQQPDEQRWPSFADDPPPAAAQDQRWPSFADEAPPAAAQDQRWPSFATEPPPPAQDEPRWPSFATEPPPPVQETNWPPYASIEEQPPRSPFVEHPKAPYGGDSQPGFGFEEHRWPSFADSPIPPVEPFTHNGRGAFNPFGPGEYSSKDLTGPLPAVRNTPSDDFLPIFSSVGSDWFRRPEPEQAKPYQEQGFESSAQEETQIGGIPAVPPAGPLTTPHAAQPFAQPPAQQYAQPYAQPLVPPAAAPPPAATPAAASAGTTDKPALPQRVPGGSGVSASWSSPADTGWQAAQAAAEPAKGGTTASGLPRRVPKANLVPGTASLAEPQPTSPAPQISPDRLRSRLSSFQQGVRQGRAFTRGDDNEEEQ
ncbi:nitrate- and nitrite sensing domain-containing protein [Nonomuraea sp. NEAU-A123]|uniref:sensor histidine kinase n=1 Tax=Nonomuraea sp. NEAU-A123 TaxID=2839649 RepID=UPI001BE3FD7E|nr:nitrate- and nitrite sensing domain-containing protein [Nonomuraea sp. NEAU-A123]MBT2232734.1 nitrate- and nitrite sensing domain-containing protein [Nonomuraea sp. NEAU-A123]